MRLSMISNGSSSGSSGGGVIVTTAMGVITLPTDPVLPQEASTKQYVDNSILSLNANNILFGILPASILPGFTGDVTNTPGSNVLSLSATGVTPGTYPKVLINTTGRIVDGYSLVAQDIPDLNWSIITSGKPNTISGYGITDAVPKTGGAVTDYITITGTPTLSSNLVNKVYLSSVSVDASGITTGDYLVKSDSVTPNGFLKCNGSIISKTDYANLYSVIGDKFNTFVAQPGAGKPWKYQYDFNIIQAGDITGWTGSQLLPNMLYGSQVIVTKNRAYLLGGVSNGVYTSSIYTANINVDGSLTSWILDINTLPVPIAFSQAIVIKNRVYLLGGHISVNSAISFTSNIYTAAINLDGTLGSWNLYGGVLPIAYAYGQSIVTNNRVYLITGHDGTSGILTTYTTTINADGSLGTWSTGSNLLIPLYYSCVVSIKNKVYILGGSSNGVKTSDIYSSDIAPDGTLGAWSLVGNLPGVLQYSQAFVSRNTLYLFGGYDGVYLSSVYMCNINLDGTLGNWVTGTSIPVALGLSQVIATVSKIYLITGYNGTSGITNVYTASITGGLNDYSKYYDGTITTPNIGMFSIPNLTNNEDSETFTFIKY